MINDNTNKTFCISVIHIFSIINYYHEIKNIDREYPYYKFVHQILSKFEFQLFIKK